MLRIDGSKNEVSHPGVRVVGFPSIYFFPAYNKLQAIKYNGERTTSALRQFLKEQIAVRRRDQGTSAEEVAIDTYGGT